MRIVSVVLILQVRNPHSDKVCEQPHTVRSNVPNRSMRGRFYVNLGMFESKTLKTRQGPLRTYAHPGPKQTSLRW